jgi:hypothetical protein
MTSEYWLQDEQKYPLQRNLKLYLAEDPENHTQTSTSIAHPTPSYSISTLSQLSHIPLPNFHRTTRILLKNNINYILKFYLIV